jgi:hypothetical protein
MSCTAARPTALLEHRVPTSRVVAPPGSSPLRSPPGGDCRTSTAPSPPGSTGRELDRRRRRPARRHGSDRRPRQRGRQGLPTGPGGTRQPRNALLVAPTCRTRVRGYSEPSLAAALPGGSRGERQNRDGRSAADVCTLSGGCRAWTRGRGGGRRCWAAARAGVLTPHSTAPPSEARARFPHTSSGCAVMLRGKVVRLTRARTVKAELVVTTRKVSISVGLVALAVLAAGCGSGDQARESPATTTSVSASATPVPGSSTTTPDASASVTTTAGDATSDDYVSDTITCYEDTTSQ